MNELDIQLTFHMLVMPMKENKRYSIYFLSLNVYFRLIFMIQKRMVILEDPLNFVQWINTREPWIHSWSSELFHFQDDSRPSAKIRKCPRKGTCGQNHKDNTGKEMGNSIFISEGVATYQCPVRNIFYFTYIYIY